MSWFEISEDPGTDVYINKYLAPKEWKYCKQNTHIDFIYMHVVSMVWVTCHRDTLNVEYIVLRKLERQYLQPGHKERYNNKIVSEVVYLRKHIILNLRFVCVYFTC